MLAYLNGIITYKSPTKIYVECAGVGYDVNISLQTFAKVEDLKEAKIFTHYHVTDQAHTIYGFADEIEKDMFLLLTSVNGVGPSTARLILSSLSPEELSNAIILEDVSLIRQTKGIGPKTAQRMILELKDKVGKILSSDSLTDSVSMNTVSSMTNEAISAMVMLGFTKNQAEKVVKKVIKAHPSCSSAEELIKLSLKNL